MTHSNLWPNNNWSKKHLNWSLILYSWIVSIPAYAFIFVEDDLGYILGMVIVVILSYYLVIWNLKHKGRSAWNIFWQLVPYLGSIIILCIKNQEQLAEEKALMDKIVKP